MIIFYKKHKFLYFLQIVAILLFCSLESWAQIIDSSFYEWEIYEVQDDDSKEKKCYMVTYPEKSESNDQTRSRPYIMITRFQYRRIEQVTVSSGFEYKRNSDIFVAIDNVNFLLKAVGDKAWAKNKYSDVLIIQNMLNAEKVMVRSDSAIGSFAVDEYSLKGIAKAYSRLKYVCK